MKYIDILNLAHTAALDKWNNARIRLEEMPENRIRIQREKETWKSLMEIEAIIRTESAPT